MKKMMCILFSGILISALALTTGASSKTTPIEPGSKEITGSHVGSKGKEAVPFNMAYVKKGKVKMGMDEDTVNALAQGQLTLFHLYSASYPKNTIKVDEFFCDIFEVTNAQWKLYLDLTSKKPTKELIEFAWKKQDTYPEKEALFPVRNISYRDVADFARWCGKRIPTEEEWCRAAAGDDGRIYSWGNDWMRGKNCTNKRSTLSPVGSYEAGVSPFGIHDMTGSVWEWTNSKFVEYPGYDPLKLKMGKKKISSDPHFSPLKYVLKGGDWLQGDMISRLDVRASATPVDNNSTLGFRCIKDVQPGLTMLKYAIEDMDGSCLTEAVYDMDNLYHIECTELTDDKPTLIRGYSYCTICPKEKTMTNTEKIAKESQDEPFPIGILSLNQSLEEPNLPPGTYTIAYRQAGLSKADKEEARKKKKETPKKKPEEDDKKKDDKKKGSKKKNDKKGKKKDDKKKPAQERPKTEEEKRFEAEQKKIAEENARIERENAERDAAAKRDMEKLGLVISAKEHIEFPRDKNLIVFMNANDTIVGFVEVEGFTEVSGKSIAPIIVSHAAENGMTRVEVETAVIGQKHPRFVFEFKIMDNPF